MIDTLIFFVLALYSLAKDRARGGGSQLPSPASNAAELEAAAQRAIEAAERAAREAAAAAAAQAAPKPWPVSAPSSLPPFPSGWEYAEPVTPAVRTRAWQLLSELWKRGAGATSVEQTGGAWITYRAEVTKGNKRGVVAYRVKSLASRARATTASRGKPASVTMPPLVIKSPGVPQKASTTAPAPAVRRTEAGKPWLHQGAGMGALEHLAPYVKQVQTRLLSLGHYTGKIDGDFGPKTKAAVLAFQKARGLQQDGVVGDNTWAALDAGGLTAMAS